MRIPFRRLAGEYKGDRVGLREKRMMTGKACRQRTMIVKARRR
jgi:hypothetical protein